ncbi:MAG: peptidoglycan D,D-transpeptidase FtsI family protein [Gammaproteobacteria bacterium]
MKKQHKEHSFNGRKNFLLGCFVIATAVLIGRVVDLQILRKDFLIDHGDARSVRVISTPAYRGVITDSNGESLAVSTPVASIWATPRQVLNSGKNLDRLGDLLSMDSAALLSLLRHRLKREFVYLKRHIEPDVAAQIVMLKIPGVNVQREYKRYYPTGEVTAHLLGFTNVDDQGQEGLELAYNNWLHGKNGSRRVLKDLLGHIVKNIESIEQPEPGKTLALSIDQRLQYLAYRELKTAVTRHGARAGMLLMLDPTNGEVLALAVQPSFNPNNRSNLRSDHFRNRVVTDVFEPGSTIKPFTIAAALQSGLFTPTTEVATEPGHIRVGKHTIKDLRNYGLLDVKGVIKKSSNVGTSKIALQLGPETLWKMHNALGFGSRTGSGYPGEVTGLLSDYHNWSELDLATISFGYGLSITALQLAQAYSIIAADGLLHPLTFVKDGNQFGEVKRVLSTEVSRQVKSMMQAVIKQGGSGTRAAVSGYHIAGKTGTAHKLSAAGYEDDKYMSLFAGLAPATRPELVMVVVIDEPQAGQYYGGQVAAPVFANVMKGALRILNIAPDNIDELKNLKPLAGQTMAHSNP